MSTMPSYPALSGMPVILLTASHSQVQKINKILRIKSVARATAITMNFNNREVGIFTKKHGFDNGIGCVFWLCHIVYVCACYVGKSVTLSST